MIGTTEDCVGHLADLFYALLCNLCPDAGSGVLATPDLHFGILERIVFPMYIVMGFLNHPILVNLNLFHPFFITAQHFWCDGPMHLVKSKLKVFLRERFDTDFVLAQRLLAFVHDFH